MMKYTLPPTKKIAAERKAAMLKKIKYDPAAAWQAWEGLTGIWEQRVDIDATTVRKDAWTSSK